MGFFFCCRSSDKKFMVFFFVVQILSLNASVLSLVFLKYMNIHLVWGGNGGTTTAVIFSGVKIVTRNPVGFMFYRCNYS